MNDSVRFRILLFSIFVPLAVLVSCAVRVPPRVIDGCFDAGTRLERAWKALEEGRANGCPPDTAGVEQCQLRRREVERIAAACPSHPQASFASAILAYEARNLPMAQQWLDSVLAGPSPYPDAAALRARIAIEEGNIPFALRFLGQQIRLTGDHAGLREVYASALFLDRGYQAAARQLEIAEKLGAPRHRVLYHRGLVLESQGKRKEAAESYRRALAASPDWGPAKSRLRAMEAEP